MFYYYMCKNSIHIVEHTHVEMYHIWVYENEDIQVHQKLSL